MGGARGTIGNAAIVASRAGAYVALVYATVETAFLLVAPWLGGDAAGGLFAWAGPRRAMAGLSPVFTAAAFLVYVMAGAAVSGAIAAVLSTIIRASGHQACVSPAFWSSLAALEIVLIFGLHSFASRQTTALWAVGIAAILAIAALVRTGRRAGPVTSVFAVDPWVVVIVLVGVAFLSEPGNQVGAAWRVLPVAAFVAATIAARLFVAALGAARTRRLASRPHARSPSRLAWVLALACLGTLIGAREWRPPYVPLAPVRQTAADRPNVILVTLDTVRWDHVSVSGYARRTTPNLERMAASATVYANAIASSNTTLSTHASIFTGLNPSRHGGHPDPAQQLSLPISTRVRTLAEILADRGYRTVAVAANISSLGPEYGFARGFSNYDLHWMVQPFSRTVPYLLRQGLRDAAVEVLRPVRADDVFADAAMVNRGAIGYLRWAARTGERFFLFLNYMDAHAPYLPRPPFDTRYAGRDPGFRWNQYARLISEVQGHVRPIRPGERDHMESQYDGAIAYLDQQLGSLFDTLRALNLYDSSLVVVTSDHGEGFGEQSVIGHGTSLYQHQLHVPLIVKYPGAPTPGVVNTLVSSVDLLPTILDTAGIPIPARLDGATLRAIEHAQDRWVSAESFGSDLAGHARPDGQATEVALFHGNLKLVRNLTTGRRQVFDLRADPLEAVDLAGRLPMTSEWDERLAMLGQGEWRPDVAPAIDAETRERLRALGYLK